jgi:phage tail-like protein
MPFIAPPTSLATGALSAAANLSYGLAMRFSVTVDDLGLGSVSLGRWSSCRGLKVDLKVTRVQEGGNYWYEHILPDRISYSNITLERAVDPSDSPKVQAWLRQVASTWMNSADSYPAGGATITLLGADGQPVTSWELDGVYPVSWSGPGLSATENKVAIETLELAHEGFLQARRPRVPRAPR